MKKFFGHSLLTIGLFALFLVMPTHWIVEDHLTFMQLTKMYWYVWVTGIVFWILAFWLLDEGEI